MLDIVKKMIYVIIPVIMLSGCSTKAVLGGSEPAGLAARSQQLFLKKPSDKVLFEEALSLIGNREKEENPRQAKIKLQTLLQQFPDSELAATAQALLTALNNITDLEAALKKEKLKTQGDQVKLTKEMSELKSNVQQMEEKYSTEVSRLQQENEQLKKDIQQLKNLEINLEKREKMLR